MSILSGIVGISHTSVMSQLQLADKVAQNIESHILGMISLVPRGLP